MADWFEQNAPTTTTSAAISPPSEQKQEDWFTKNKPPERRLKAQASDRGATDSLVDVLRPIISGIAGGAAGTYLTPRAAPIGYSVADMLIQQLYKEPPRSITGDMLNLDRGSMPSALANTGEQYLFGKVGEKLLGGIWRGAKASLGRNLPEIYHLDPTTSQLLKSQAGDETTGSRMSQFVEDFFATSTKELQREKAAQLANTRAIKIGMDFSGRAAEDISSPTTMDNIFKLELKHQLRSSFNESNRQAAAATSIAGLNPIQITNPASSSAVQAIAMGQAGKPFAQLNPQQQQYILNIAKQMGASTAKTVEGPIYMGDTLKAAKKYIQDREIQAATMNIRGVPTDDPLVGFANRIISETGAEFDPAGNLIKADPVSFRDAWTFKQLADKYGFAKNSMRPAGALHDPTSKSDLFEDFSHTVTNDIDSSIPSWKNGGTQALQHWKNSKGTVAQRLGLFAVKGDKIGDIVEKLQDTIPELDAVIGDHNQLQRALNIGEIKFPSGNIAGSNLRRDLQGYQFMKMFRDSLEKNPLNSQVVRINADKFSKQWLDENMQESFTKLYGAQGSPQREAISEFVKNIAATQDKTMSMPIAKKLWITRSGIGLGIGLTGMALYNRDMGVGGMTGVAILGTYLTGSTVGKLLSNKNVAKFLVNAAGGQPLGASEAFVSRLMSNALQGMTVGIMRSDGSIDEAKVTKDGYEPTGKKMNP